MSIHRQQNYNGYSHKKRKNNKEHGMILVKLFI